MSVVLLFVVSLMTTGEYRYDISRWTGPDLTSCRTYSKEMAKEDLPVGVRDAVIGCLDVALDPLRSSRPL